MRTFEEFKKSLGALGEHLTDEEIEDLRHQHHQLAKIIFHVWLKERNTKKIGEAFDKNK